MSSLADMAPGTTFKPVLEDTWTTPDKYVLRGPGIEGHWYWGALVLRGPGIEVPGIEVPGGGPSIEVPGIEGPWYWGALVLGGPGIERPSHLYLLCNPQGSHVLCCVQGNTSMPWTHTGRRKG